MSEKVKKNLCWSAQVFGGGSAYGLLEILWRGYTHFSMLVLGGICFWMLVRLSRTKLCLSLSCLIGGVIIAAAEFLTGCVVNLWLGLDVWDYSNEPCQLMGQVCIRFFLLWCAICALVIPLCRYIRKWDRPYQIATLKSKEKQPET